MSFVFSFVRTPSNMNNLLIYWYFYSIPFCKNITLLKLLWMPDLMMVFSKPWYMYVYSFHLSVNASTTSMRQRCRLVQISLNFNQDFLAHMRQATSRSSWHRRFLCMGWSAMVLSPFLNRWNFAVTVAVIFLVYIIILQHSSIERTLTRETLNWLVGSIYLHFQILGLKPYSYYHAASVSSR